jgi:5-bromo-4-chloroindolyl phosphate hydrolysis protein
MKVKNVLNWFIRAFASTNILIFSWLILFFGFNQMFWISALGSILLSMISYFSIKRIQNSIWLKKVGVSSRDYRYINKSLKEAKEKINRLQKVQLKIRSLGAFKQLFEMNRLARRIFQLVKQQPQKFYTAENFFFYHLDSAVELSEKYAFIAAQPGKSDDMFRSLQETRTMLEQLTDSLEEDLQHILSDDMNQLKFELEFTKKHISSNSKKTIK